MSPRFDRALLAYVHGTLSDPMGVDAPTLASLYALCAAAPHSDLRRDVEAAIRRVEKRGDRFCLSAESLSEIRRLGTREDECKVTPE